MKTIYLNCRFKNEDVRRHRGHEHYLSTGFIFTTAEVVFITARVFIPMYYTTKKSNKRAA